MKTYYRIASILLRYILCHIFQRNEIKTKIILLVVQFLYYPNYLGIYHCCISQLLFR